MSAAIPVRVVVRLRRGSSLELWIVGSLAIHLAASVLLSAFPMLRKPAKQSFEGATIVALAGPPAPSVRAAAVTPPAPPTPVPVAARPAGPSAVKEVPKPAKPPKKKDEPKTQRAPETPPPVAPSEAAAPDAPIGGAPPESAGAGITSLDPVDASLAWYHDTVNAALDRNWIRPPLEDAGGTVYAVVVAFEIARDGSVRGVKVESSSGVQVVDLSAVRAVRDSAPFPPPPPGRRDETVRARIRFEYDPGRE